MRVVGRLTMLMLGGCALAGCALAPRPEVLEAPPVAVPPNGVERAVGKAAAIEVVRLPLDERGPARAAPDEVQPDPPPGAALPARVEEPIPATVVAADTSPRETGPAAQPATRPDEVCDRPAPPPLPAPGSPGATSFWQTFRDPLPAAAVWDPPGRKRVGLQAGHWRVEEVPAELGRLGHGSSGGGRAEWEVNLEVARRTAAILERAGVEVDVLPATVPARYRAHVFLSIHADGDERGVLSGYKLARPGFSATPAADDRLLATLYEAYGEATGLPRDDLHITRRMTAYYAFNSRRYCHAVAPGVPSAILEMGFLTNASDRRLLLGNPEAAARGVAAGLLRNLGLT